MENFNGGPDTPMTPVPPMAPEDGSGGNGMAIASLVLGIVSIVLFCGIYISVPCGVLAIIFGILAIKKNAGKGMATAGLIMGIIGVALTVIIAITAGAMFASLVPWMEEMEEYTSSF